ncbi:hypothetical protein INT43_000836 [Umbelopsis isabellina]|uniref:Alpha N-terminal protein methyltransferase 1 n=1 Tax=Mortierella isabellina TaxID=91625 RepID=A0A8H7Q2W6_MORIS|nr:hypothetical protein INT43_000836 [Umbelopsis isabellina]
MSNDTVPVPQFADQDWYTKAVDYWSSVDPTVNGMLGGFESVCPVETAASLDLIHEFVNGVRGARNVVKKEPRIEKGYACDCGAGIGRVTKEFLLRVPFAKVDLVEQTPKFVEQAKNEYLKEEIQSGKVGEVYCKGLQEFTPDSGKYDLIWCQWVLGHLTDDDLVSFLKRCKEGLRPNGIIGIKENNATKGYIVDEEDSSVTRSDELFKKIFKAAGYTVLKEKKQHGLPAGLFMVKM